MEHLQTIQQIFTARFLRVPDYQRGYAWTAKHWQDLLDDLDLLEVGSAHYTGTLVLHRTDGQSAIMDEEGREHGVYDIVDGQQRLTTIVILLDAIRRELSAGSPLAEGIKKTYVVARDVEGQLRPKLTLNRDTREFFEQTIIADRPAIDGPKIRSEQQLKDAHVFLRQHLGREKEKHPDPNAWLLSLHKKITNSLRLTVYEVPRASEVGVIFEVMNNRGKPLSEMEKVKNYLLYLASKLPGPTAARLGERVNRTWSEIFEGLMAASAGSSWFEDQLLRAHSLAVYDHRPKSWTGNDSIKARFGLKAHKDAAPRLLADLEAYVESLRQFSIAYCDLIAPRRVGAFKEYGDGSPEQRRVQHAAEKLARMDALASFLPLLGAVRLKQSGNAALYVEFLELCERYTFRVYRWAEKRSNAGQTRLFKFGHDLYHERLTPSDALASIKRNLLWYAPTAAFHSELEVLDDWYGWYGLKYFLYEYEEHLAKGKAVQLPWAQLVRSDKKNSIEHILPQTPDDPYWTSRWQPDEIRAHLHDIGNLSLTFDNSSYGNKAFPKKKGSAGDGACYANSNLFMERALAKHENWTKDECLQRRKQIVEWARTRWEVVAPTGQADSGATIANEEDDEDEEDQG